jgi:hypothetical protein
MKRGNINDRNLASSSQSIDPNPQRMKKETKLQKEQKHKTIFLSQALSSWRKRVADNQHGIRF